LHFVLFLAVGLAALVLAYAAGEAAERRGDARVFLLSLAFLATGGFLALHALGTPGVLLARYFPGFAIAIPVGMLVAALFACASAFIGGQPRIGGAVMRQRVALRLSVFGAMALWWVWTTAQLPPLAGGTAEGGGIALRISAALGA